MTSAVQQLRLVVQAADYDAAVAFYRDVLGLEEQESYVTGQARVAILGAGRATLELVNDAQHGYIDQVEVGRPVAGHLRVAFEVADTRAVTQELTSAGAQLVAPPTTTPWRSLNARLDAPAGLHVTVFQEPGDAGEEPQDVPAPVRGTRRADLFLPPEEDPREGGPSLAGERETLQEYLRYQRLTLELKCSGLTAEQLARRPVPPSTLSLLGLVRHLAEVERSWFRRRMAGLDVARLYSTDDEPDGAFDGAVADPGVVERAWRAWRTECAFSDRVVAEAADLDVTAPPRDGRISLREVLVHMVEEYARHNGHADLLRERIDGRVGQ